MPTDNGSHNQPQWDLADDADFAADLSTLSNYVATVGNSKVGTTTQRNSLTGKNVWNGLQFRDITVDRTFYYKSGGWLLEQWGAPVNDSFSAASSYRGTHNLGQVPRSIQIQDQFYTGASGKRNYLVTELTASEYVIRGFDSSTGNLLGSTSFSIYVSVFA